MQSLGKNCGIQCIPMRWYLKLRHTVHTVPSKCMATVEWNVYIRKAFGFKIKR